MSGSITWVLAVSNAPVTTGLASGPRTAASKVSVPATWVPRSASGRLASASGTVPRMATSRPLPDSGTRPEAEMARPCGPATWELERLRTWLRYSPWAARVSGAAPNWTRGAALRPLPSTENVAAGLASGPVTLARPETMPARSWPGATALRLASGKRSRVTSRSSDPSPRGTAPLAVARKPSGLVTVASICSRLVVEVPLATTSSEEMPAWPRAAARRARPVTSKRMFGLSRVPVTAAVPSRVPPSARSGLIALAMASGRAAMRTSRFRVSAMVPFAETSPPPTASARPSMVTFWPAISTEAGDFRRAARSPWTRSARLSDRRKPPASGARLPAVSMVVPMARAALAVKSVASPCRVALACSVVTS